MLYMNFFPNNYPVTNDWISWRLLMLYKEKWHLHITFAISKKATPFLLNWIMYIDFIHFLACWQETGWIRVKKIFQNTKTDILMILTYFALIRCARAFPISIVANLGGESANEKCGRTLAHNFASCDKRRTPICAW